MSPTRGHKLSEFRGAKLAWLERMSHSLLRPRLKRLVNKTIGMKDNLEATDAAGMGSDINAA